MNILLWVGLGVLSLVLAESAAAAVRYKRPVGLRDFFRAVVGPKPFHAGHWVILTSLAWIICVGLLVLYYFGEGSEREMAAVEQERPELLEGVATVWESSVFGSTIHKIVVGKTFGPEEVDASVRHGATVEERTARGGFARFIAPTGGEVLWHQTPDEAFNQFAGTYRVHVRLKRGPELRPLQEEMAEIVVWDGVRRVRLAERKLRVGEVGQEYTDITLEYTKDQPGAMPLVQLYSRGRVSLWMEALHVEALRVDMDTENVEDLFPDVPDTNASEGLARYADPDIHLAGVMAFGPYDASLAPGEYTAVFTMKTDAITNSNALVRLQAASLKEGTGEQVIHTRELRGTDFRGVGTYQPFSVPLTVEPGSRAEVRVQFLDRARVWLDHVQVYTAGTYWDEDDAIEQVETRRERPEEPTVLIQESWEDETVELRVEGEDTVPDEDDGVNVGEDVAQDVLEEELVPVTEAELEQEATVEGGEEVPGAEVENEVEALSDEVATEGGEKEPRQEAEAVPEEQQSKSEEGKQLEFAPLETAEEETEEENEAGGLTDSPLDAGYELSPFYTLPIQG